MSLTVDGVWKAGVWTSTVWTSGVWYEPGVTPAVTTARPRGVPSLRRQYAEVDNRIVPVDSFEEAEKLLSRAQVQDRKDRKRLKLLVKKYEVVIPEQKQVIAKEIEFVSARIDDRYERMALLSAFIQEQLEVMDDEEALMVLLQ